MLKYTASLNENEGSVSQASKTLIYSNSYGTLPIPQEMHIHTKYGQQNSMIQILQLAHYHSIRLKNILVEITF